MSKLTCLVDKIGMKRFLTTQLLQKYNPKLIVVFGQHGRQSAREAIAVVLQEHTTILSTTAKDFFSRLYEESGGFFGVLRALFFSAPFPHVCIVDAMPHEAAYQYLKEELEYDTAVVMPTGDIPSFSDIFAGTEKQTKRIMREAKSAGAMLVCSDDETVRGLADEEEPARVQTFGFEETADFRVDTVANAVTLKRKARGDMHVKVDHNGTLIPFNVSNAFGKRAVYAAVAALGVALRYDINLVTAAQDLKHYRAPQGELTVQTGVKYTALFSHYRDTTPFSAREALEFIGSMREAGHIQRAVVVLGDVLLHHPGEAEGLHRTLGELAAHTADILVLAGQRVIFTAEEAQKHGMAAENIYHFDHTFDLVADAAQKTQEIIKKGDGVLVVGAEEMEMHKVVQELKYIKKPRKKRKK